MTYLQILYTCRKYLKGERETLQLFNDRHLLKTIRLGL